MRVAQAGKTRARVTAVATALLLFGAGCGHPPTPRITGLGDPVEQPAPGTTGGPGGTPGPGASPGSTGTITGGNNSGGTGNGGNGGSGSGGTAAAVKPCGLVTSAEAGTALGVSSPPTASLDTDNECLYESGSDGVMVSLQDEVYDPASVDLLSELGPSVTKLPNIGDAAFQVTIEASETQYHVWIKGKYLAIILDKAAGNTVAPGRALLDKALTRL